VKAYCRVCNNAKTMILRYCGLYHNICMSLQKTSNTTQHKNTQRRTMVHLRPSNEQKNKKRPGTPYAFSPFLLVTVSPSLNKMMPFLIQNSSRRYRNKL